MVDDLVVMSNTVAWNFNNKYIEIEVQGAYFASENEQYSYICIESGEKFIAEKIYF